MDIKLTPEDLRATGCNKKQIEQFASCQCKAEKLKFLQRQRERLLHSIHEQERRISTLDYLTYQLTKTAPAIDNFSATGCTRPAAENGKADGLLGQSARQNDL